MSVAALQVEPTTGHIGAEVEGVDLRRVDDVTAQALWQILLEHRVIFLRHQHLDTAEQIEVASRFGTLTAAHPTLAGVTGHPEVLDLDYGEGSIRANNWHTDVTFVPRPPTASILRALDVPTAGGDTMWADTVTAYIDLPDVLRKFADTLWAVHTNEFDYLTAMTGNVPKMLAQDAAVFTSTIYRTLHPVVRVHPETGERSLLLGRFARSIAGLSPDESTDVIRLLQARIVRPEHTVRWRWSADDVAIWDNRATQHYAISDYGSFPRHMRRVTLAGELPASITGRQSQSISGGDPASYDSPSDRAARLR